jgi:hypothetical protein
MSISRPPRGNALIEYLIALAGLGAIWVAFERSPAGLGRAIADLASSYSFLLSIPW